MLDKLKTAMSAALLSSAISVPALAQTSKPVRITLDFAIQGQQAPFIMAADNGYFDRAGVKVTVERGYGSADAIGKIGAGTYDVAFADIGAMIQFNGRQKGAPLISVFQVYDATPMVVLALKKSGISKPSDLAGKKMAGPPASSSRVMFPVFAAANKLDLASISWLDVTPQLRETMLAQRQADATVAFVTDLPGLARLKIPESDLNIMRFPDYGIDLIGHGVLVKQDYAKANPDIIRKIIIGYAEALKASLKNPDMAIAAIKKREPLVTESVEKGRLLQIINTAIITENVKKNGLSSVTPERVQKTIDTVSSVFKLPPMTAAATYTDAYLPDRKTLMLE